MQSMIWNDSPAQISAPHHAPNQLVSNGSLRWVKRIFLRFVPRALPHEFKGRPLPAHFTDRCFPEYEKRQENRPNLRRGQRGLRSEDRLKYISLAASILSLLATLGVLKTTIGTETSLGILLILVFHELGHLVMIRWFQIKSLWPLFLPWVGAIILMQDPVKEARKKAWIGLAGPIAGVFATCALHVLAMHLGSPALMNAVVWGYTMHLFNLIPSGSLDGGHIAGYLSRWLWVPGTIGLAACVFKSHWPWYSRALLIVLCASALPPLVAFIKQWARSGPSDCTEESANSSKTWLWVILALLVFVCLRGSHSAREASLKFRSELQPVEPESSSAAPRHES